MESWRQDGVKEWNATIPDPFCDAGRINKSDAGFLIGSIDLAVVATVVSNPA